MLHIHEGMKVIDRIGQEIGTIKEVQFSDEDPDTPEPETTTSVSGAPMSTHDALLPALKSVLSAFTGFNELPGELRQRLQRHGFIRIDTGLLSSDRYAVMDQVEHAAGDRIVLNVTEADLIKR